MARRLMVIMSNAVEGRDEDFNDWYDNVHLPAICSIEGVVSAARYEIDDDDAAPHRYMTIYEIDREGAAVMDQIVKGMASGEVVISDSLDPSTGSSTFRRPR